MELSPHTIRSTGFRTVKKGYDPSEVDTFREQVASAVEFSQNQATAMEARARAAVAKLQEVSQQGAEPPRDDRAVAKAADTETISRTLLLAQRTADATVNDAKTEAHAIVADAREEAGRVLDGARTMAGKTIEDAKADARRSADDERVTAENEVQALLARRDFLLADVEHLEQHLEAQRDRLREAAVQLHELIDRVPGGLGEMRRPLLSASAQPSPQAAPAVAHASAQEAAPDTEPAAESPVESEGVDSEEVDVTATTAEVPVIVADAPASVETVEAGDVWRMLDDQAGQRLLDRPADDPFRISGDDLR